MKKNSKSWLILSLCFLLIMVSIVCFIQSRSKSSTQSITLTNVGFDTSITFQADCTDEEFAKYTKIVENTFKENNKRFDQYHAYSKINNIYTINHEAANHPIEVDQTTMKCIKDAIKINQVCSKFDISYGSVMNIWHDYREQGMTLNEKGKSGNLPSQEELNAASQHTGMDKIQIQGNAISLTDSQCMLDLGGIAKGYTAQLTKEKLNKAGLHNGFINAGGNVVLIGKKSDGSNWNIGVQNPDSSDSLLNIEVDQTNQAIVTSGDYQRYYTVNGTRYSHIIDPDTLMPAKQCRSVTVLTKNSTKADGLSTALFSLNFEDGYALAKKEKVQAIWIFDKAQAPNKKADFTTKDFKIYTTKSIRKKVSLSN